jgi:hypothetical protein
MRKSAWFLLPAAAAAIVAGVSLYSQGRGGPVQRSMPAGSSFRILLGVNDREPTQWDGSITVSPGAIASITGWRFVGPDSTDSVSNWQCRSRQGAAQGANQQPPMLPNGVIVTTAADSSGAAFNVKTAQGNFSFAAADIPWGQDKDFLDGRVVVERVPSMARLTDSTDEQDYPAMAQSDDMVYLSYVQFVHANRDLEGLRPLTEAPANFDYLARPAGGDQVFLMTYSKSKRTWSEPVAVSAARQDVMRTAVAVDGQKRVWVVWSAQQNGNFDIYAKSLANGRWSREIRLTTDPGTDLSPVAATDSQGRVWLAWQGFRNNNLEVLAAVQNGDSFSPETIVSFSKNSDWDPAIAAAPNGEVAVAWDTYDKGDYDVYFRRLRMESGIKMDAPVPVAASPGFEARASVAYDKQNRLWVAYEASDMKWGKDYGAYETSGIALYQDHTARVKCFQGNQAMAPAGDLAGAIPGAISAQALRRRNGKRVQAQPAAGGTLPDPNIAKNRQPSGGSLPPALPKNSFPRITADPSGAVYLSFRTPMAGRGALGTAWEQNLAYLDGSEWKGPIAVPNSDFLLDERAPMVALAPGDLMMIAVSDHRYAAGPAAAGGGGGAKKKKTLEQKQQAKMQPKKNAGPNLANQAELNTDLYAAEFHFASLASAQTHAIAAEKPVADPEAAPERDQIATMRNYRVSLGSDKLQIMRGEFHRHTEISGDGGNDGPLVDAYRYLIDAADMDWAACCDHDNGAAREYSWWVIQKYTDAYHLGGRYVPMFGYERSVVYPEGHRNAVFPVRGVRPLPRLPLTDKDAHDTHAPDTLMLYRYLKQFGGIVASHTSGTDMGTDWRDNDPQVEPVVEIYQGDRQNYEMPGAPRTITAEDHIGGWEPLGFVSLALKKGYKLGFQASSDHISTHMSYANLWVASPTREAIMEAFHKRRIYGSTDNILADVRCGSHFMGEEFTTSQAPSISVKLWGTANFAKVHIIKDGQYVYSIEPKKKTVDFTWQDAAAARGTTSYYYVRGEQADGELVWVSPMWITYK